jgi:uncharacterized membrane protein
VSRTKARDGRFNPVDEVINVLHIVTAVFIVGPMAILPMSGMRAMRARNSAQVASIAKSTFLMSLLSLLVVVFGFGAMSLSDHDLSVTTPWILWSIILYAVALALTLALVVPTLRKASAALDGAGGDTTTISGYGMVAGGAGLSSLLLIAVVVLMVVK